MTIEASAVIHFFDLLDTLDEAILAGLKTFYGGGYCQSENSTALDLKISQRENILTMNRDYGDRGETKIAGNKNHD
jgi:hypothetical protein